MGTRKKQGEQDLKNNQKKQKKILTARIKFDILNGQLEKRKEMHNISKKVDKKQKKMLTRKKKFDILETQLAKKDNKRDKDL